MSGRDYGKVVIAILEAKIETIIGKEAILELKKPVLENDLQEKIARASEIAEKRWLETYSDKDTIAAVLQMPIHDLPAFQEALRMFYDHPSSISVSEKLRQELEAIIPNGMNSEQITKAVGSYLEELRKELLSLADFREKINALANLEIARNTAESAKELHKLVQIASMFIEPEEKYPSLLEKLPSGGDGRSEFVRIVDLLVFHEARRAGIGMNFPINSSNDRRVETQKLTFRIFAQVGYCYVFDNSLKDEGVRREIQKTLTSGTENSKKDKIIRWVVVTPMDLILIDSEGKLGDATWFEDLRNSLEIKIPIVHWGYSKLISLFKQTPSLCLFYYPELVENGQNRHTTLRDTQQRYVDNLQRNHNNIEFVGMSVYKPEATRGVPMQDIYIPLSLVFLTANEDASESGRLNPLELLSPGVLSVLLGDPGSGKSTLIKFLALCGNSKALQRRYKAKADNRLPILITLRRYADELKSRRNLALIDYIRENLQADYNLPDADNNFLLYYFETGQTIFLLDGLDELPSPDFKEIVRNRINSLVTTFPGNTTIVTSRIVGYDNPFRFNDKTFIHYRVAHLKLPEMERFVHDWYAVHIDNDRERQDNINDLIRILNNPDQSSIRELAENPLLLTIIALVHRIDAVLPDERVVLYQKCTETLLNTWHTWKYRGTEMKGKDKLDRRNRKRMEMIAFWMHQRAGSVGNRRAVIPFDELKDKLTEYIRDFEKTVDPDYDPEDLAVEFLRFIKERAGLLIEVGDKQYSFVHLTFQEYLTSSYIITYGETGGVQSIYETIRQHIHDARWSEVIRLLIAGLRSDQAQEFLIGKILTEKGDSSSVNHALLLNGLLQDNVDAARIRKQDILQELLVTASKVTDKKMLDSIFIQLKAWIARENLNINELTNVFRDLWLSPPNNLDRLSFFLVGIAIGLPEQILKDLLTQSPLTDVRNQALLLVLVFADNGQWKMLLHDFQGLWALEDAMCLENINGAYLAALSQTVTGLLDQETNNRHAFEKTLVSLSALNLDEPFFSLLSEGSKISNSMNKEREIAAFFENHYNLSRDLLDELSQVEEYLNQILPLEIIESNSGFQSVISTTTNKLKSFLNIIPRYGLPVGRSSDEKNIIDTINRLLFKIKNVSEYENFNPTIIIANQDFSELMRFLIEIKEKATSPLMKALERVRLPSSISRKLAYERTVNLKKDQIINEYLNKKKSSAGFYPYDYLFPIMQFCFDLEPSSQWSEALRVMMSPRIPYLMSFFTSEAREEVILEFSNSKPSRVSVYGAAFMLIYDAWLYLFIKNYDLKSSSYVILAELTRDSEEPPLRIAHCIRDLAYGDKSREQDLVEMVRSSDPNYQAIFELCLWKRRSSENSPKASQKKPKKGSSVNEK